jgi:hypothetical protein
MYVTYKSFGSPFHFYIVIGVPDDLLIKAIEMVRADALLFALGTVVLSRQYCNISSVGMVSDWIVHPSIPPHTITPTMKFARRKIMRAEKRIFCLWIRNEQVRKTKVSKFQHFARICKQANFVSFDGETNPLYFCGNKPVIFGFDLLRFRPVYITASSTSFFTASKNALAWELQNFCSLFLLDCTVVRERLDILTSKTSGFKLLS